MRRRHAGAARAAAVLALALVAATAACVPAGSGTVTEVSRTGHLGFWAVHDTLAGRGDDAFGDVACATLSSCLVVLDSGAAEAVDPETGRHRVLAEVGSESAITPVGRSWLAAVPEGCSGGGPNCSDQIQRIGPRGGASVLYSLSHTRLSFGATACSVADRCVVGGSMNSEERSSVGGPGAPTLRWTADGGRRWSPATQDPDRQMDVEALACPQPLRCIAAGTSGRGQIREIVLSADDGGARWAATFVGPVGQRPLVDVDVECKGQVCIVAGDQLLLSTDAGATWRALPPPVDPDSMFIFPPAQASCLSGAVCLVAASPINLDFSRATGWRDAWTVDGGRTWILAAASDAFVDQIVCPSPTECVVTNGPYLGVLEPQQPGS